MTLEIECAKPTIVKVEFLATTEDDEALRGALEFYEITSEGVNDGD